MTSPPGPDSPLRDARSAWQAISRELLEVAGAGVPAWIARDDAPRLEQVLGESPPIARLLGAFDTYLLGYQGRHLAVAPQYASNVNAGGGGMIRPVVIVDGEALANVGYDAQSGRRAPWTSTSRPLTAWSIVCRRTVTTSSPRRRTSAGSWVWRPACWVPSAPLVRRPAKHLRQQRHVRQKHVRRRVGIEVS